MSRQGEAALAEKPYLRSVTLLRDKIEDFEAYPFCVPVVRLLRTLEFHPDVTFFVGDNGSGKSTLIEAIAVLLGLNPEGGCKYMRFRTEASHSELHKYLRPTRSYKAFRDGYFLRAESFYNVATMVDALGSERYYGGKSLHRQSHGESFMSLLTGRFGGQGVYVLDEPEAALSPTRQMAALRRIDQLVKKDSQFIIATHSPILLAYPNALIYELKGPRLIKRAYEETEHYKVTRRFLGDYRRQLEALLEG